LFFQLPQSKSCTTCQRYSAAACERWSRTLRRVTRGALQVAVFFKRRAGPSASAIFDLVAALPIPAVRDNLVAELGENVDKSSGGGECETQVSQVRESFGIYWGEPEKFTWRRVW